jgi:hypothetical protein
LYVTCWSNYDSAIKAWGEPLEIFGTQVAEIDRRTEETHLLTKEILSGKIPWPPLGHKSICLR